MRLWLSAVAMLGLLLAVAAVFFPATGTDADLPPHVSPPDVPAQAPAASSREPAFPRRPAPPVPAAAAEIAAVPTVSEWERVERDCPWPPTPDSWIEVSAECNAAMMALDSGRVPLWRSSLSDPEGTRRAVVAALDDPQCRVPAGEKRPDLYEACAAEALIRFAEMQHGCVNALDRDWDRWEAISRNLMSPLIVETFHAERQADGGAWPSDQEIHHRQTEAGDRLFARGVWEYSLCSRTPPGVLDWLDVLPVPEANPEQHRKRGGFPVPTQAPELLELARRLGATRIPKLATSPLDSPLRPHFSG